jgi:hypothetical protein
LIHKYLSVRVLLAKLAILKRQTTHLIRTVYDSHLTKGTAARQNNPENPNLTVKVTHRSRQT